MNEIEMLALGASHIHWNPDYKGGVHEYFLPIKGNGLDRNDSRLAVRFKEHTDRPFHVWLIVPRCMVALDGVKSTANLLQAYKLITGEEWSG